MKKFNQLLLYGSVLSMAAVFCSGVFAQEAGAEDGVFTLEEVVVTAARREQSAQDYSGSLQVFSGEELDRLGADDFEDVLLSVSGISFREQGNGSKRLGLRGVSNVAGSDNGVTATVSTVGIYLNDVPILNTSNVPDVALYDLNRIEVLKGPQGTLYGEGAMGGAVRIVMNEPDATGFAFGGETTLSGTEGGGFNYGARGYVNVPLVQDKVALRLAGGFVDNDGFVDNLAHGDKDHNSMDAHNVRALLSVEITDRLSAEIMVLYDKETLDEFAQMDETMPDLQIVSLEPRFNEEETKFFGLTLNYDLGFAGLTSVTSWYDYEREQLDRIAGLLISPVFGPFAAIGGGAITEERLQFEAPVEAFSQEIRLVSEGGKRFDWVLGGFYRDKELDSVGNFLAAPGEVSAINAGLAFAPIILPAIFPFPLPPLADNLIASFPIKDTFEQFAVYGEGNFELTDGLELTFGLRWYDETVDLVSSAVGSSLLAVINNTLTESISEDGVVWKAGLAYRFTEDAQVYGIVSTGFRSPVVNSQAALVGDPFAESDTTTNFELGYKGTFAGGRATLNVSGFYVDWSDIQAVLSEVPVITASPASFPGNAGDAEIYGVEADFAALLSEQLRVGFNFAYTDSELDKSEPNAYAVEGATLPNVPEWTANGFIEYRAPLFDLYEGFLRFDASFSDDQATRLITTASPSFPAEDGSFVDSWAIGNLRAGIESENWGVHLFIDNLWDERAELGRGSTGLGPLFNPERISITRPRTFGVTFRYNH